MEGISIGLLICRILALLSAIIVLGLSANGLKDVLFYNENFSACYYYGYCFDELKTALQYATFVGVFGFVSGVVGLLQFFFTANILSWTTLVLDGLASIFYLAGGIYLAVALSDELNGRTCPSTSSFCAETEADIAFMFIALVAFVAAGALVFVTRRRA